MPWGNKYSTIHLHSEPVFTMAGLLGGGGTGESTNLGLHGHFLA